jgi:hypothetical protein
MITLLILTESHMYTCFMLICYVSVHLSFAYVSCNLLFSHVLVKPCSSVVTLQIMDTFKQSFW